MLKFIYTKIPLPISLRHWISRKIPDHVKREKHLKKFGVINDLYFWRTDNEIETIAPIQNFYSSLFPNVNTKTKGHVWIWDNQGKLLDDHDFLLSHMGCYELNINKFTPKDSIGTFMWHISIPDSVANIPEVENEKIYFTDRGYICFLKNGVQPIFMHGIDRFSTFQKQSLTDFDLFYKHDNNKTWIAEFPLNKSSEIKIDIILINRSMKSRNFTLDVFKNGNIKLFSKDFMAPSKSVVIFTLTENDLSILEKDSGYFSVSGIPTPWGRPAIMRHFKNGAISVMHC
jgi:hypothetical protein